jgi:cell division protein FtsN
LYFQCASMTTEAWQHNAVESSRMSKLLWSALIIVVMPVVAAAQASAIVNPAYRRAQDLVNGGNPTAGRAVIDSMLSVATQGTNEYAEGIYWRAVLAATAADAEMDYRRIVVDYPQSPRVEDALIRLSQLEIARANYDGAIRHLNTLITEHPESPSRARAGYWMARALFDKNDIPGGCAATSDALARTSEDNAELRNQITYLNQRCAGVALNTQPQATTPQATSQQPTTAPPPATQPQAATPQATSQQPTAVTPPPADTVASKTTGMVKAPPMVKPVLKPAPEPATTSDQATSGGGKYSVQIAAYNVKSQAVAMVAKLKKRGYEARVDGEKAPFRVRIGRYATAGQASAVQRSLKAKQIDGFVVQADTQ